MAASFAGGAGFRSTALSVCTFSLLSTATLAADEIQLKTVKIQGATDGAAVQGYRAETVSGAGPWQGRKLQDTPYAITVFSEELIKNLQATTPDQVLRINPTTQLVRPQHENNQPRVMIRGFSVQTLLERLQRHAYRRSENAAAVGDGRVLTLPC